MARDEPDPRFLGGETAVLTNVQDMALVVAISHDGAADIHASVSKEKAAAMLRYIADQWDPPSAGVAAGPQATPDQVLWEGETTEAERISGWSYVADNEGQQRRDWGRCSLLVQVPGGTRVRVVAVPTDPTTVRVAEVRRPIPGARDMTGVAVHTDHEDQP